MIEIWHCDASVANWEWSHCIGSFDVHEPWHDTVAAAVGNDAICAINHHAYIHAHTAALWTIIIIVSTSTMHRKSHSIPNMKRTRTFCPFPECDAVRFLYSMRQNWCCVLLYEHNSHYIIFVFCPFEFFLVYNFLPAVDNLSPSFFTSLLSLLLVLLLLLPVLWGRSSFASTPQR